MAPPKKPVDQLRRRYTISLDAETDRVLKALAQLTQMQRSHLMCWAIRHLWREIQEQNLDAEE